MGIMWVGNRAPTQLLQLFTCFITCMRPSIVAKEMGRSLSFLFSSELYPLVFEADRRKCYR